MSTLETTLVYWVWSFKHTCTIRCDSYPKPIFITSSDQVPSSMFIPKITCIVYSGVVIMTSSQQLWVIAAKNYSFWRGTCYHWNSSKGFSKIINYTAHFNCQCSIWHYTMFKRAVSMGKAHKVDQKLYRENNLVEKLTSQSLKFGNSNSVFTVTVR